MTQTTPKAAGFSQPAEWAKHSSVWLAWPSAADLWEENLPSAQAEFTALCKAIADLDENGHARGEDLNILVPNIERAQEAEKALSGLPVHLHLIPFGDIWLRDTAPIFVKGPGGEVATVSFKFNGWGEKYMLPYDSEVSARIAGAAKVREFKASWILEGGSVEVDGLGTCLTSRQCLLNPNRNPGLSQAALEEKLRQDLGVEKILWVGDGLINDHTDGHIDTIARYAAPGVILAMQAQDENDPNREIMETIIRDLKGATDARGETIKVGLIPSPGAVLDEDGELMPASYLNFYIGNSTVVVPTYGSPRDAEAVKAIAQYFPNHRTVGLSAKAILSGGGAFHCISQQVPV
jgi:agmatine deiminase